MTGIFIGRKEERKGMFLDDHDGTYGGSQP
jgi:hypothetical protein